jgi:hypothetical protein
MQGDTLKKYLTDTAVAERTANAYIAADQDTTCAATMAVQAEAAMQSFVNIFASYATGVVQNRGTGAQASESSLSAAAERLCENAVFICPSSQRYGTSLPGNITCPGYAQCNQQFADADINPD